MGGWNYSAPSDNTQNTVMTGTALCALGVARRGTRLNSTGGSVNFGSTNRARNGSHAYPKATASLRRWRSSGLTNPVPVTMVK